MNTNTQPYRIVFCITELEPGGAERCLVELVRRLDPRRFDPLVYCLGPRPTGNPSSLADVLESSGVTVRYFNARRAAALPWLVRRVRRLLQADAPRLVQSFLFHANVVSALAARYAGGPPVVTGIRVAEHGRRWHLSLARWTDRWVARHVCVSGEVRDFMQAQGRLPAKKLLVIPNGVDVARFENATACALDTLGIAAGHRAITFVGRLEPQKNLPWLFARLPTIFSALEQHDLLIVGTGPDRVVLEQIIARRGFTSRVHFAGFRDNVPEILAASDLLVLPSLWEGMPNVVLEAMAAGKPVMATDAAGVAEVLGAGQADQMVVHDEPELFSLKLVAILNQPGRAAELGRQNRQRVRDHFSFEGMVGAYERLYSELLSDSK